MDVDNLIETSIRMQGKCVYAPSMVAENRFHQNLDTDPALMFDAIFPFHLNAVIGVECMFARYWIADFCSEHKIPFVLVR